MTSAIEDEEDEKINIPAVSPTFPSSLPSLLIYPLFFKMKKKERKIDTVIIKMNENMLQVYIFSHVGEAHPWDVVRLEQLEETGGLILLIL